MKIVLLLLLPTLGFAQTKIASDSLTIEKAISRYRIGVPKISPDEKRVVFVVAEPIKGNMPPNSDLWMYDIEKKDLFQFTSSPKSDNSPKWSPDGKLLAFLSSRNGDAQVFLISVAGGEALVLTKSKSAIRDFEWSPDGKSIAYLAAEPATEDEEKRTKDQDDETNVNVDDKPTRLWTIDVATKKARQRSRNPWNIREMKWLPTGLSLLLVTESLPKGEDPNSTVGVFTLIDSSYAKLPMPGHGFWGGVKIAADGKSFGYTSTPMDGPTAHDLFIQSLGGGAPRNITSKNLDLPVSDYKFMSDGTVQLVAQKGFTTRMYTISPDGSIKNTGPDQNAGAFDASPGGVTAFTSFTSIRPEELWLRLPGQSPIQITNFNKAFDDYGFVKPEFFVFRSFDGQPVEASYYKPKTHGPWPLVVLIHGGPTGAWTDSYYFWTQLFVRKGYAVICPNVRGSTGYGHKFIVSNKNDWGGGDFKDVMAGVDFLIKKGEINANRMGIAGWSYGGYMSMWAVTQTNRFKAAMAGAGLSDLASEYGTETGAFYDRWFFGTPYENAQNFSKSSPITFVKNAKTPTLIIQGEKDPVDPVGQSQQFYRGLRHYNVPTELVLYPREPHGFSEEKHIVDFARRMLEWFEKYCK